MAKKTQKETVRRLNWWALLRAGGIVALLAGAVVGVWMLHAHVRDRVTPQSPPQVLFAHKPAWMSDLLMQQIIADAKIAQTTSALDDAPLKELYERLRLNPWVRQVKAVRRVYGKSPGDTIEVDCDFRTPIALVRWGDYFWLVDTDGCKLPEHYTKDQLPRVSMGSDGRVSLRQITGVRVPPPMTSEKWQGDDLKAGLELVRLLYGRDYTEPIVEVDVSNHAGRISLAAPPLILRTSYDPPTALYWGRPPSAPDAFVEVSADVKLAHIRQTFLTHKRVDAGKEWLDLRFEQIREPRSPSASTTP